MDLYKFYGFFGVFFGIWSCTQTLPQDPIQSYRPVAPAQAQTLQSEPSGSLKQPPQDPSLPTPSGIPEPLMGEQGRETLLQLRNATAVMPKDYRIGSLSEGLGVEQKAAREVLVQFLASLVQGKTDLTLVHSQWRTLITSTLEIQKSNGPRSYRLGPVFLESEDTVRTTVALTGPNGRADGWIYLEKEGSAWRISDWQVDLLSIPTRDKDEIFDPEGFPLVRGFP